MTLSRIDTHHHILPPGYLEKERDRVIASAPAMKQTMLEWTPQKAIDAMDATGIATAVTSISAPGIWFGNPERTRALARECNEFAARLAQDRPGRFGIFAVLPIPDIDACLDEIAYALDVLKVDGFGLVTSFGNVWPGDPSLAPIFDELNRRKAVVYFHPTTPDCCTGILPGVAPAMMEFPFDTTRAVTSLLRSGTFARCRDIRFIFSHGGGTLTALAPRISAYLDAQPQLKEVLPHGAMHELARLYYDVVGVCHPMPFGALRQMTDLSHLLFGSDYPFLHPRATVEPFMKLNLSGDERAAIERGNALALLPTLQERCLLAQAAG